MVQLNLIKSIAEATNLDPGQVAKVLVRTRDLAFGDFAFPCFMASKNLRTSPAECAKKLEQNLRLPEGISKVEAVGPYLNFFCDTAAMARELIPRALGEKTAIGKKPQTDRTIVIDYFAPNIAKTLHVGHLRTTFIGASLYRLFRHLGYQVIGVNHLGDWGTQFGFVFAGCEIWGKPENATVDSLVDLYVRASALRKAQEAGSVQEADCDKPDVNLMARDYFRRLEDDDPDAHAFWQWCLDISLQYFQENLDRLGIHFDYHTGESFYRGMIGDIERKIKESGILENSRGALGVELGKELGFVRVFAEDGRSLYITRDIAAAVYRTETFKPEKILYVVAAQQTLHFKQLVELLRRMKHPAGEKVIHVPFGFVPGMKTREGGGISLKGFLDEAHRRALDTYREEVEKRPEGLDEESIAESVAIGATYFYFLSHSNIKDFQFSWKEALTFHGDSGPYVQYALARINSIETKAAEAGITETMEFNEKLLDGPLEHELLSILSQFDEALAKTAADYEPYHIALYCLDLAKSVSKAYRALRVVGEEAELARSRLALFLACKYVLHTGLTLIGVPAVERM